LAETIFAFIHSFIRSFVHPFIRLLNLMTEREKTGECEQHNKDSLFV